MSHSNASLPSQQHPWQKCALWAGVTFLIAVLIFSSLAAAPLQPPFDLTATPQPLSLTPLSPTALPAEYYQTEEQSTTILVGAVVLVLIISISSMSVMFKRKPNLKK